MSWNPARLLLRLEHPASFMVLVVHSNTILYRVLIRSLMSIIQPKRRTLESSCALMEQEVQTAGFGV